MATGNELVPVGKLPVPGQKINSNAVALAAMVEDAGGEVVSSSIAADSESAVTTALQRAVAAADVVISCGGVSVGDYDFVKDCLGPAGIDLSFWKVAMKPGKPLVHGRAQRTLFFGLPGNPGSAMVCFELFVRPALLALQGAKHTRRATEEVVLEALYEKQPGRTHLLHASLKPSSPGRPRVADVSRKQGSGRMATMVTVDALVEIPADVTGVDTSTPVVAHLLT